MSFWAKLVGAGDDKRLGTTTSDPDNSQLKVSLSGSTTTPGGAVPTQVVAEQAIGPDGKRIASDTSDPDNSHWLTMLADASIPAQRARVVQYGASPYPALVVASFLDSASGGSSVAITTATTTQVKATGGVIGSISNAANATTGVITVYDSTSASGKLVWVGTLAAGQVQRISMPCVNGITVVTAGANAICVGYV